MTQKQIDLDVQYLIEAAPRLIKVAGMAAVFFGSADGARYVLRRASGSVSYDDDWFQALLGYQDGAVMMAIVRVSLLLDSNPKTVTRRSWLPQF